MTHDELGMAWWNRMTERQRAEALRAANTAVPAEAWQFWYEHQLVADSGLIRVCAALRHFDEAGSMV